MARSAVNVEALLAPFQNFFCHWEGHVVAGIVANLARIKIRVLAQISARDCPRHQGPCGTLVLEEIAPGKRILFWLHVHIQAAAPQECQQCHCRDDSEAAHVASWAPPKSNGG